MSESKTDVTALLKICRDIEMGCAQIYQTYAERFADDEELAALWSKTAAEEENHARQFTLAISLKRDNGIATARLDLLKANQTLSVVRSIHAGILEHLPSRLDALCAAINLEKNLAQFHLDSAVEFRDESLKKMFQAMMKSDNCHLQTLEKVYKERLKAEKSA